VTSGPPAGLSGKLPPSGGSEAESNCQAEPRHSALAGSATHQPFPLLGVNASPGTCPRVVVRSLGGHCVNQGLSRLFLAGLLPVHAVSSRPSGPLRTARHRPAVAGEKGRLRWLVFWPSLMVAASHGLLLQALEGAQLHGAPRWLWLVTATPAMAPGFSPAFPWIFSKRFWPQIRAQRLPNRRGLPCCYLPADREQAASRPANFVNRPPKPWRCAVWGLAPGAVIRVLGPLARQGPPR